MFTQNDIIQINQRGSTIAEIEKQIEHFVKGFPFMKILKPATKGDGITVLSPELTDRLTAHYDHQLEHGLRPVKFVPASGAASRMFQSLFAFAEACRDNDEAEKLLADEHHKSVKHFFDRLADFTFYGKLNEGLGGVTDRHDRMKYVEILDYLLGAKGLNYGFLPKGLLLFHQYPEGGRTPVEEHMVEGALYGADSEGKVKLHFTVSPEHLPYFEKKTAEAAKILEPRFGVKYDISFSEQKPSTDTIAVGADNEPFRTSEGKLFFRPGGHGALLENLNDIDGDLIFVKNIDNVVPDRLKEETVRYKKALAGVLVTYQEKIFDYLKILNRPAAAVSDLLCAEIADFAEKELCILPAESHYYTEKANLMQYLKVKLNRPIRVCGMVINEGEPGGGPFWARNADGTTSLQVVESSQIDLKNPLQQAIAEQASHFNPVDLVCGVKNFKGQKFDLLQFRDPETGFISHKSKDGKPLKAQELPGLWNGAMSDWITLFVEVPAITFNPVKTVNDLLRNEHQPE